MIGQCLCNRVSIEVEKAPEFINVCNCKFCRGMGAAWGYYLPADVSITGTTAAYGRQDLGEPQARGHFCPTCGCTTHFEVILPGAEGTGVNTRLFAQEELEGIEVRYYDGRSRERGDSEVPCTATGRIGDGMAF
ncbi:GFA family protein [Tsuneonella troitsensis]|uniref:GFA family protein n=1 Tax=Tsuneonella troitsensis TaxID=292222 RepID=UPI00070CDC7E|nr:hypothetical protein [Tsuneonella troitsensis]